MKILKSQIEPVLTALNYTLDTFSNSRIRDKFIKVLGEEYQTYILDRQKIINEFCDKDKEGDPIKEVIGDKVQFNFTEENTPKVNEEMLKLDKEEITFEGDQKILEFIENSKAELKPGMTLAIDEFILSNK